MPRLLASTLAALGLSAALAPAPATAQGGGTEFLGQMSIFPYTFCPRGWIEAAGQLLPIAQNTALFSLYGTTFGGDGRTTFGVPDMRGRVLVGIGNGPGLSPYVQGQKGGQEQVTLTIAEMPSHNHPGVLNATTGPARTTTPTDGSLSEAAANVYTGRGDFDTTLEAGSVTTTNTGGGQAHNNIAPYIALRVCVATTGIYPSRN